MARITLAPLAATSFGSVGNATLASTKGVPYLKQRRTPRDPRSAAQLAHRASIALTGPIWRGLSDQLQDAYVTAPLYPELPGYHTFVSRNRPHLQALDGLVGPAMTPGRSMPFDLDFSMHFVNMWWADYYCLVYWTPPICGPEYRLGYADWDATEGFLDSQNLNLKELSSISHYFKVTRTLHLHLFMGFVYRTTDQEIVHCHHDAAIIV